MRILVYSILLASFITFPWYLHAMYSQSHTILEITTPPTPYAFPKVFCASGTDIEEVQPSDENFAPGPPPKFTDLYSLFQQQIDEVRIISQVPPDLIDQVSAKLVTPDGHILAQWDHTAFQPISPVQAREIDALDKSAKSLFSYGVELKAKTWQAYYSPTLSYVLLFVAQFALSIFFVLLLKYVPVYRVFWRRFFRLLANPPPFAKQLSPLFLSVLCLVTTTVFSTVIYSVFGTYYGTVDDPYMALIIKGYTTEHPEWHVLFMHPILSYFLMQLYRILPNMPWYVFWMNSVNVVSFSVVFYAILRRTFNLWRYLFCFILILIPGIYLIACTQFTMVSSMACLAGIALLLGNQGRSTISGPRLVVIIFLFFIGAATRIHPAMLLLVLFGPYIIYQWFIDLIPGTRHFVAAALTTLILLSFTEKIIYNMSPEWREAKAYDVARGKLAGTEIIKNYSSNTDVYQAVGWSRNDLALFNDFIYENGDVFSKEKLNYLIDHLRPTSIKMGASFWLIFYDFHTNFHWVTLFLLWLMLALSWRVISPVRAFVLFAPCAFILVFLAVYVRLPERVLRPTLFAELAILLLMASTTARRIKLRSALLGSLVCLLVTTYLLVDLLPINYRFGRYSIEREQSTVQSIETFSTPNAPIIINPIVGTSLDQTYLWQDFPELKNARIFQLSFFNSPIYEKRKQYLAVNDAFLDLTHRDDLVFATSRWDFQQVLLLQTFLKEHYAIETDLKIAKIPHTNQNAIFPYFTLFKLSAR